MDTVNSANRAGILASLLASERMRIVHSPDAPTAYFDLRTREITLPTWQCERTVYDFLVGHEVAHAKHTPADQWEKGQERIGGTNKEAQKCAQDFINVVEDARIERFIKQEFPGLRADFREGYKKMWDMDAFGVKGRDLRTLRFIDRLNLHYKVGVHCGIQVPFTAEEQDILTRISALRPGHKGFADVVDIAEELFKREFTRKDDMQQPQEQDSQGQPQDGKEDGEGNGKGKKDEQKGDEKSEDGSNGTEADQDGEKDAEGEGKGNRSQDGKDSGGSAEDDTDDGESAESRQVAGEERTDGKAETKIEYKPSETMAGLEKAKSSMVKTGWTEQQIVVNAIDHNRVIVPVDDFIKMVDIGISQYGSRHPASAAVLQPVYDATWKRVLDENKRGIDLMCKRFETRRAARDFARQGSSKTGRISTRLLNKYKFSEDIFDRVVIRKDEKNHGLVILIDWSGSMGGMVRDTVEQVAALLVFCRRCGIPAQVFYFTSSISKFCDEKFLKDNHDKNLNGATRYDMHRYNVATGGLKWDMESERHAFTDHICNLPEGTAARGGHALFYPFSLVEVYNPRMNNKDFVKSMQRLLVLAQIVGHRTKEASRLAITDHRLSLGTTPLDESILALRGVVDEFRKNSNTKVTFINLTDGEGTTVVSRMPNDKRKDGITVSRILVDKHNGRRYDLGNKHNDWDCAVSGNTNLHLATIQMFKDATNASVVGIYMTNGVRKEIDANSWGGPATVNVVQRYLHEKFGCDYKSRNSAARKACAEALCKQFCEEDFMSFQYGMYDSYFVVDVPDRDRVRAQAEAEDRRLDKLKNKKVAATRSFIAHLKADAGNRVFLTRLMDCIA